MSAGYSSGKLALSKLFFVKSTLKGKEFAPKIKNNLDRVVSLESISLPLLEDSDQNVCVFV